MQVQLCSISGEEEGSPLSHLFLKQSVFLNLWNKKLNFNETVSSLFEIMLIITEKDYKIFEVGLLFPFPTHTLLITMFRGLSDFHKIEPMYF